MVSGFEPPEDEILTCLAGKLLKPLGHTIKYKKVVKGVEIFLNRRFHMKNNF